MNSSFVIIKKFTCFLRFLKLDAELSFDMLELLIEIIAVKKMCSSSGHIGGEYSTYNKSWSGGFLWGGVVKDTG